MRQSPSPRGDRTLDHSMCYHMSNHQGQIKQYEWPGLPSKTMFCEQDWVDQFVWFESCSSDPMDQSRVKFKSIPFQFCPPLLWETSCRTMAPRSRPWQKNQRNWGLDFYLVLQTVEDWTQDLSVCGWLYKKYCKTNRLLQAHNYECFGKLKILTINEDD